VKYRNERDDSVIPSKAGIQWILSWIPARAGTTKKKEPDLKSTWIRHVFGTPCFQGGGGFSAFVTSFMAVKSFENYL
jgi:hypothetical protein